MARRRKRDDPPDPNRWVISYADFITLLFAFFTALYAISTVDRRKVGEFASSTRTAFNMDAIVADAHTPSDAPLDERDEEPRPLPPPPPDLNTKRKRYNPGQGLLDLGTLSRDLKKTLKRNGLEDSVTFKRTRRGLVVSIAEGALFRSGRATLSPRALRVLDPVAELLVRTDKPIRVEGHTDSGSRPQSDYETNWDLSSARAVTVVKYLIEEFAYPPDRLSAVGYAGHRPVANNSKAAGRNRNRRVDLAVLRDTR